MSPARVQPDCLLQPGLAFAQHPGLQAEPSDLFYRPGVESLAEFMREFRGRRVMGEQVDVRATESRSPGAR